MKYYNVHTFEVEEGADIIHRGAGLIDWSEWKLLPLAPVGFSFDKKVSKKKPTKVKEEPFDFMKELRSLP
jgi:hypothetical protein